MLNEHRLCFPKWYGPACVALSNKYPDINFAFAAPYDFFKSIYPIPLATPIGSRITGWYYPRSVDHQAFAVFRTRALESFIRHGNPDEYSVYLASKKEYLLHRNRDTRGHIDREAVLNQFKHRCARCGTQLDLRFFQTHETRQQESLDGLPGAYIAVCGDCHRLSHSHAGGFSFHIRGLNIIARGAFSFNHCRPLYLTSRGNLHREHYAHLQRLKDVTQVWPELEIRWESDEDQELYSQRELSWMREVSVGRLCKTCTSRLGGYWPDTESDFSSLIARTAYKCVGAGRFHDLCSDPASETTYDCGCEIQLLH